MTRLSYFFLFLLAFTSSELLCQEEARPNRFASAFELQIYPTGIIPGVNLAYRFSDDQEIDLRFGYQFINHRDLGVHDEEKGDGLGVSLGYNKYFGEEYKKFSIGIRSDLWINTLDWKDNVPNGEITGTSKVTVLQPTIIAGWSFPMSQFSFTPTLAFGYEVNVHTTGEDVGQGAILLVGFKITR